MNLFALQAGQIYGVPLEGLQLTKPGTFPDQRSCGEEFRKKWIEVILSPHQEPMKWLSDEMKCPYWLLNM